MSEKRGYPNPNYGTEDVGLEPIEMNAQIMIDDKEYREVVSKAAMFDCLASAIRAMGRINDDVVMAITGTLTSEPVVPKKEADNAWRCYFKETEKVKTLEEKVAQLDHARNELIEILKQNGIGQFAENQENTEVIEDGQA